MAETPADQPYRADMTSTADNPDSLHPKLRQVYVRKDVPVRVEYDMQNTENVVNDYWEP